MILLMYAVGDFVIQFHQHYSIGFFMGGHAIFLIDYMAHLFFYTFEYIICVIGCCIMITTVFSWLFGKVNKDIGFIVYFIYILYIFSLSLVLVIPLLKNVYLGHLFFILSDVLIGFKVKHLSILTFPLYYTSLLYLLYFSVK